jgi:hypothetical protein
LPSWGAAVLRPYMFCDGFCDGDREMECGEAGTAVPWPYVDRGGIEPDVRS